MKNKDGQGGHSFYTLSEMGNNTYRYISNNTYLEHAYNRGVTSVDSSFFTRFSFLREILGTLTTLTTLKSA